MLFVIIDNIATHTETYPVILADPPWTFMTRSSKGKGRSAEKHYDCMSFAKIKALPVADLAAKDCTLFMWVTDPMLPKSMELLDAWGFTYKTVGFYWAKTNKSAGDTLSPKDFFTGMGYWTRANPEQCLLATRGHPKRRAKDVRRLIVSPRREHSRKPDETYDRIERLVAGPYLELFSRTERPGWDCWGNEAGKFNGLDTPGVEAGAAARRLSTASGTHRVSEPAHPTLV